MATYLQRAQSIGNAIVNGTSTLQQIDRLGQAIAFRVGSREHYLSLTTDQKAEFIVRNLRDEFIGLITTMDVQLAAQSASSTAATEFRES